MCAELLLEADEKSSTLAPIPSGLSARVPKSYLSCIGAENDRGLILLLKALLGQSGSF